LIRKDLVGVVLYRFVVANMHVGSRGYKHAVGGEVGLIDRPLRDQDYKFEIELL
jgi:hypothetical protein